MNIVRSGDIINYVTFVTSNRYWLLSYDFLWIISLMVSCNFQWLVIGDDSFVEIQRNDHMFRSSSAVIKA